MSEDHKDDAVFKPMNDTLYTDLPIDQLEARLALEELEDRLEQGCLVQCHNYCFDRN